MFVYIYKSIIRTGDMYGGKIKAVAVRKIWH